MVKKERIFYIVIWRGITNTTPVASIFYERERAEWEVQTRKKYNLSVGEVQEVTLNLPPILHKVRK